MPEPDDDTSAATQGGAGCFLPAGARYNRPARIVTLGHFYPQEEISPAKDLLRETRPGYGSDIQPEHDARAMRQNLGWTQLLNALSNDRQWPIKRLFAQLDPILELDIALAVVPTHLGNQAFWPMRTLARQLAEHGRVDATSCLVRHTTIRRITFGGPSTKELHRQTIRVENPHLVAGQRVLLLDDIARSGMSLIACRELLLEAGAILVQAMALGRVIVRASRNT